jgi:3-oxoadipate enol-lactonase
VVRERFLDIDGRRMRFLEAGAGWPVLLIHAFPLSADMWRPQLDRVPEGWRFIAPDLRGFGKNLPPDRLRQGFGESAGASAKAEGGNHATAEAEERHPHHLVASGLSRKNSAVLTMDDYARDIGSMLDRLKIDEAVIGGLSMGGYVTFALFRQSPERFTGMVLADTRPQADTADGRAARAKMRDLLAEHGPSAVADQMIPKLLAPTSRSGDPALVERTRRMIEANAVDAIDGALGALMERPDSTGDLPGISCPTLVIVGEDDEVTPQADAELMKQEIPRSLLMVIQGAGHLSNLERPFEFSRALHDFLVAHM